MGAPIHNKIYTVRERRVMLDSDLAALYGIETRVLKQAVRRNRSRFPEDFMFEITEYEYKTLEMSLRSQFVISNQGGLRYMPFAFTEQGVAMLSSILKSDEAIAVNIRIMRSFVAMRQVLMFPSSPSAEIEALQHKVAQLEQATNDNLGAMNDLSEDLRKDIDTLYEAIGALSVKLPKINKPLAPIGFKK